MLQQQVNAFTNAPFLLFEKAYSLNTYWGLKSARIFFCEEVANAKHFLMIILCKIDIRNGLNVGIFFLRQATLRFNFQGRRGLERFFCNVWRNYEQRIQKNEVKDGSLEVSFQKIYLRTISVPRRVVMSFAIWNLFPRVGLARDLHSAAFYSLVVYLELHRGVKLLCKVVWIE